MNYWIWFSSIKNCSSINKQILLKKLKTPENIFKVTKDDIVQILNDFNMETEINIDNIKIAEQIELAKENVNLKRIERIEKYMQKSNIQVLDINNEKYPKSLKNIYDPPITLFLKGNVELLKDRGIAVIGSRNATEYGLKMAYKIAYELSQNGFNVISGLAKGIDASAHKGALKNFSSNQNGSTIAVIGSRAKLYIS